MPVLINTGPTERGWSWHEAFARCPRLWAYQKLSGIAFPPTAPLVRGCLLHAGLAHLYARLQAVQEGRDPEEFYTPMDAIEQAARELSAQPGWDALCQRFEPVAKAALAEYQRFYAAERFKVVAVEKLVEVTFFPEQERPDGTKGYRFTQRLDLITEDRTGRYWIYDHKGTSKVNESSKSRYTLSGQFLAMERYGATTWGPRFGGVRINLVGFEQPFKFERVSPEPAPAAYEDLPYVIKDIRDRIDQLVAEGRIASRYPAARSEQVCMTAYGKCPAFDLCRWGTR